MQPLGDFVKSYNFEDVVLTVQAMPEAIEFYNKNGIDMLKLGLKPGCTVPNVANICLHELTNFMIYPIAENGKHLLEFMRRELVGGPFAIYTRKVFVVKIS